VCGDAWIAVGDAASAFDPLSSAGVVKALYSGKLGAFAVLDLLRGVPSGLVRYRQYVEREYAEYLTTRSQFYGRERRWRDSPFWSRRTNGAPSDGNRIVRRERPAVPLEFRCSKCGQVKDVRTLRASVCPDCTASAERDAVVAADAGLTARKHYETALARGPHYTGALEDWTPKDPVLLADGQHFVCPACKRRAHLVHDLAYRWQKKQFPIPTKYTPCDDCHRKETDDTAFVRPRNRFSRER
jgi:hypothetical protein